MLETDTVTGGSMDLSVAVEVEILTSGAALVRLHGVVDSKALPVLERCFDQALAECPSRPPMIALDLSAVSYLDTDGLDAILGLQARVAADRGRLELHHPTPSTLRMLHEAHADGASWGFLH